MNSKKAKKLRNQAGGNEAVYSEQGKEPTYYITQEFQAIKTGKGTPRRLDKRCSRYVYKQLKSKGM